MFLSNFIKLIGHYILRVLFMGYEWFLNKCNRTSRTLEKHRERLLQKKLLREHRISCDRQVLTGPLSSPREFRDQPGSPPLSPSGSGGRNSDLENGNISPTRATSPSIFLEEEDETDGNFLNASLG